MLPTVPEEIEVVQGSVNTSTSSARSCNIEPILLSPLTPPSPFNNYPLDITDILQEYTFRYPTTTTRPVVIISPGEPDRHFPPRLGDLKMADVVASSDVEYATVTKATEGGSQDPGYFSSTLRGDESGATKPTDDKTSGNFEGVFDSATKLRSDSTLETKTRDLEVKARNDSESGRSGGEDGERRNGGTGWNRRRNSRNGGGKRVRDKKWWVCPDPSCRNRNSATSVSCANCGMAQDQRGGGRHSYARNWEKTRVTGLVVTHVCSPTTLYLQTPQQQSDYARLRNCMAQAYATTSYRPSLVAAKMLLGVRVGDCFERVRTEERRGADPADGAATPAAVTDTPVVPGTPVGPGSSSPSSQGPVTSPSSCSPPTSPSGDAPGASPDGVVAADEDGACEWRVQLVDRGSWCWVREDALNFLLAGLSDLSPLAAKYTLNELRLKREATEAQVEESRQWLDERVKGVKVTGDIYRQTRDSSSVIYIDLYVGDSFLNKELCGQGTVEPKTNLKWLKPGSRISTSSVEDGVLPAASQPGQPSAQEGDYSDQDQRSGSASPDASGVPDEKHRDSQPRPADGRDARVEGGTVSAGHDDVRVSPGTETPTDSSAAAGGGSGRRTGYGRRLRSGEGRSGPGAPSQQRLPPLHDWAVVCFDQRTSYLDLRSLCELVERVGKENRISVSPADSIREESCDEEGSGGVSMGAVLAEVIATHPRLLLLLCVLPHHVLNYSGLERTGRSLGVCVVCVRGDSLAEASSGTASRLLKDLQTALLNSPAILPNQGWSSAGNDSAGPGGRRRRDNRNRRNQNRRRNRGSRERLDSKSGGAFLEGSSSSQSDPRLQAVIGAASQGIALLQRLAQQPGQQAGQTPESSLSPGVKSLLQTPAAHEDIAKALASLDALQVSYNQARSFTHEAFHAAGNFFSHLSNAIEPAVAVESL